LLQPCVSLLSVWLVIVLRACTRCCAIAACRAVAMETPLLIPLPLPFLFAASESEMNVRASERFWPRLGVRCCLSVVVCVCVAAMRVLAFRLS